MGINIGKLLIKENLNDIQILNGKIIAFDTSNILYQLLSSIRLKNGELIKNNNNEIISHLYGLFFKICFYVEKGIQPVFVFDGLYPNLKFKTLELRKKKKLEAEIKMKQAFEENNIEIYIKYSKRCFYITKDIINSSKELFHLMGIPIIQSPSEGEAQASYMSLSKTVDYVSSQDYDTLLFGARYVIRNLTVSSIKLHNSEILSLDSNLNFLGLTRDQLIDLCLCIGTDFNDGIPNVGYKTAFKLIKKYNDIDSIIKYKYNNLFLDVESFHKAKQFFLNPPVLKNYNLSWSMQNTQNILSFLCDKNNFDYQRTLNYCNKFHNEYSKIIQKIEKI